MYTVPLRDKTKDTTFLQGIKPPQHKLSQDVPQLLKIFYPAVYAVADLEFDVLCTSIFLPPSSHAQIDPNSVAKMTFMNGRPRP